MDISADTDVFFGDFAEWVIYRPLNGIPRSVKAIVDRSPPESMSPHGLAPRMTVMVANDPSDGISSREIDTGGDMIDVADRVGCDATSRPIAQITSHDEGFITVEVR